MESHLTLSVAQWDLVLGVPVMTLLAMVAGFVDAPATANGVGVRFRSTVTASSLVCLVATFSYIAITLSWIFGYHRAGDSKVPTATFQFNNGLRYMDWSTSEPLLMVELVGISVLTRVKAFRTRTTLVAAASLMIATGFLGDAFGHRGVNDTAPWIWGGISTLPFIVVYLSIFGIYRESARSRAASTVS